MFMLPFWPRAVVGAVCILVFWMSSNWIYQVVRKPSELLFPVSDQLYKTPRETWDAYGNLFREHATRVITADLLAALAQVEANGNPIVRTYWSWSPRTHPFEVYRPASSAVGLFQITDGTFEQARRYCIHNHVVVEDGAWDDPDSCWFNALYTRTVPSHAVELTSAYLDRQVAQITQRFRNPRLTLSDKHALATVVHLCGAGAAAIHARRGYRFVAGHRCGDHDQSRYVRKVGAMQRKFVRLSR